MLQRLHIPGRVFPYVSETDEAVDHAAQAALLLAEETDAEKLEALRALPERSRAYVAHHKYIETGDRKWLCLRPGVEATWFSLAPPTLEQQDEIDGMLTDARRQSLAFVLLVRDIAPFRDLDEQGNPRALPVRFTGSGRDKRLSPETVEAVPEVVVKEVGYAALRRARLPDNFPSGPGVGHPGV